MPDIVVRVKLSAQAAEAIRRPIVGQGGFQSALRRIQGMLQPGDALVLTVPDLQYLARLATRYKNGGFQDRLKVLFRDLRLLATAIQPFAGE